MAAVLLLIAFSVAAPDVDEKGFPEVDEEALDLIEQYLRSTGEKQNKIQAELDRAINHHELNYQRNFLPGDSAEAKKLVVLDQKIRRDAQRIEEARNMRERLLKGLQQPQTKDELKKQIIKMHNDIPMPAMRAHGLISIEGVQRLALEGGEKLQNQPNRGGVARNGEELSEKFLKFKREKSDGKLVQKILGFNRDEIGKLDWELEKPIFWRRHFLLPGEVGQLPVLEIAGYAFNGEWNLKAITIPDGVVTIGPRAFSRCSNLKRITIPDSVTSIGDGAFYGCESLANITLPDSVTRIGGEAFSGCKGLKSITIPKGVQSVGEEAFRDCPDLEEVIFRGDAPPEAEDVFDGSPGVIIYRIPGAEGWLKDWSLAKVVIRRQGKAVIVPPKQIPGKVIDGEKATLQGTAEKGDPEAQFKLAQAAKSLKEKRKWFSLAAESGHAGAQFEVGKLSEGEDEAFKWYRQAAEQGLPEAQVSLAEAYELGLGVDKSLEEAVEWYRKAVDNGFAKAQRLLKEAEGKLQESKEAKE